jgi:hypothetical protein
VNAEAFGWARAEQGLCHLPDHYREEERSADGMHERCDRPRAKDMKSSKIACAYRLNGRLKKFLYISCKYFML